MRQGTYHNIIQQIAHQKSDMQLPGTESVSNIAGTDVSCEGLLEEGRDDSMILFSHSTRSRTADVK